MSATMERTIPDQAAQAEADLTTAEGALEALTGRMASGGKVTSAEWQRAEAEVRFATARRDAAMQAAERQAAQERADRIAAFRASIPERLDPAPMQAARERLAAAMDAWGETCAAHNRVFTEVWSALTAAPDGPVPGVSSPAPGQLLAEGVTYRVASTQSTIRTLAGEAIRHHFGPRQNINLERPMD